MEGLAIGLMMAGFLGLLVSLVMLVVALVKKKKKKPWILSFVAFFVLLFIGAGLGAITAQPGKKVEKPPAGVEAEKPAQKKVKEEVSLEAAVEKVVIDVMGKTVNWSGNPKTVIAISKTEQVAGPDKGGYLITIEYRANENLTASLTKAGIIIDAMNFTKKLYAGPALTQIKIYMLMPYLTLVDKYGNESEEQVGKLVLRRAIANRINWENMYRERFEQILQDEGELWLHPAIKK